MDRCANCSAPFKEREKGYNRFSLEKVISATGNTARCHLEQILSVPVTPVSKKTEAKFLCPVCWNELNNAAKYKKAVTEFLGSSESTSYVGSKRLLIDIASPSTSKRPRFTSTPLKVRSQFLPKMKYRRSCMYLAIQRKSILSILFHIDFCLRMDGRMVFLHVSPCLVYSTFDERSAQYECSYIYIALTYMRALNSLAAQYSRILSYLTSCDLV